MILIAQKNGAPTHARLVARLLQAGHRAAIAHGRAEALELIGELDPTLVILDRPNVGRCPDVLCAQILEPGPGAPPLLGLVAPDDPEQRAGCEQCMTLLHPDTAPSAIAATAAAMVPPSRSMSSP